MTPISKYTKAKICNPFLSKFLKELLIKKNIVDMNIIKPNKPYLNKFEKYVL